LRAEDRVRATQGRRELGGPDPIDRRLGSPETLATRLLSLLRTRSALGLAPSLTPATIFLPLGALLGPAGLGLFSTALLARLDVAVTIALAVLGVLVGIALGRDLRTTGPLLMAASLESGVTIAAVAGASMYFLTHTGAPVGAPIVAMSLALALCASASSATSSRPDSEPVAAVATRVADLDDVLPIVMATFAFAVLPGIDMRQAWVLMVTPISIGVAVGALGWLLFERAESGAERGVFVLGALALAGGGAAYLRASPLIVGLIAGFLWTIAPGRADRLVEDDLRRVQHPLVVLLLVTAGALWTPTAIALWLLVPYLLFRLVGKVAGAWASAGFLDVSAGDLAAFLMPSGVLAIAFALNFRQVLPSEAGTVLISTVGLGTVAFELFSLAVLPQWRRRR
jgi:hypothetical protein